MPEQSLIRTDFLDTILGHLKNKNVTLHTYECLHVKVYWRKLDKMYKIHSRTWMPQAEVKNLILLPKKGGKQSVPRNSKPDRSLVRAKGIMWDLFLINLVRVLVKNQTRIHSILGHYFVETLSQNKLASHSEEGETSKRFSNSSPHQPFLQVAFCKVCGNEVLFSSRFPTHTLRYQDQLL